MCQFTEDFQLLVQNNIGSYCACAVSKVHEMESGVPTSSVGVSLVNCGPITIGKDALQQQQPVLHPLLKTPAATITSNRAHSDQAAPSSNSSNKQVIAKVLIKAVSKNQKSSKTFTLRNIDTSLIKTRDILRKVS